MAGITVVSRVLGFVLATVLSFLVVILCGTISFAIGAEGPGWLLLLIIPVGCVVFAAVLWLSPPMFRALLEKRTKRIQEPYYSGLLFGLVGMFVLGGGMLGAILLLGHARPEIMDITNVPIAGGLGFVIFGGMAFLRKEAAVKESDNGKDR